MIRVLGTLLALVVSCGCMATGYVAQAGLGQLDLYHRARDIDEAIADPSIPHRTRVLLLEVDGIVAFAEARGLSSKGNYRKYVSLPREAVVWFTAASKELSLEPKEWDFPIVGSFTYLGWFDFVEAMRFRRRLQREGYDVYLRGVRAFSTGGWFRDPILSTMLPHREENGVDYLVNVLLHEMTHANVLVNDQSTFNESVASFVGDTMTEEYLVERFGSVSPEVTLFREEQEEDRARGKELAAAYATLDTLYKSDVSRAKKLAEKKRIMKRLERDLELRSSPNNAMLIGFRTYNAGLPEFRMLYEHCGRDWKRFLAVVGGIDKAEFPEEQVDAIGPVIARKLQRPCR